MATAKSLDNWRIIQHTQNVHKLASDLGLAIAFTFIQSLAMQNVSRPNILYPALTNSQ